MTMPPEIMKELIEMFRIDVTEQLETITVSLDSLDKTSDPEDMPSLYADAMRGAHNLKGAARGIGVTDVQDIASGVEKVFLSLINEDIQYGHDIRLITEESMKAIRQSLNSYLNESSLPFDKADLLARLDSVSGNSSE